MKAENVNVAELSTEELEAILAQKKKAEKEEKLLKKKAYEKERNDLVVAAVAGAVELHSSIVEFKTFVMPRLNQWLERMREYGEGKEDQQNFQLLSEDGNLKVVFTLSISKGFDERSKLAEEKLKKFLSNYVRKKDKDIYELVISLLERNKVTEEFDISNINRLYTLEDKFEDQDWKDALTLFKESYVETKSKNYARFFKRGENNEWKPIVLDFAAV